MNEAETRAELIDPKLKEAGWGVVEGSKILRERNCQITAGRIQSRWQTYQTAYRRLYFSLQGY